MAPTLGYVEETDKGSEIEFGEPISQDVLIAFENSLDEIENFKQTLQLYELLKLNEKELFLFPETIEEDLRQKHLKWNGVTDNDLSKLTTELNRRLLNYLSSIRMYTDHSETFLKRKFGDNSSQANFYLETLSFVYDESFAYRFFYKLRNYSQHCGLPIENLGYSAHVNHEESFIDVELKVAFDRDKLLHNFKSWGQKVKTDLLNQPQKIEFLPLLDELITYVHILYEKLRGINLNSILLSIDYVKKTSKHLRKNNSKVCLFSNYQELATGGLTMSVRYVPYEFIDSIVE